MGSSSLDAKGRKDSFAGDVAPCAQQDRGFTAPPGSCAAHRPPKTVAEEESKITGNCPLFLSSAAQNSGGRRIENNRELSPISVPYFSISISHFSEDCNAMERDPRVIEVLQRFEERKESFSETSVASALKALADEIHGTSDDLPSCLSTEIMAFQFQENCQDREGMWRTYYGPRAILENSQGKPVEIPSLKDITPETLDYWQQRAREAQHPILRARYAGLVWDFAKTATGRHAEVRYAHLAIDSELEILKNKLHKHDTLVAIRLRHSLMIAMSINDSLLIDNVRRLILAQPRIGNWSSWASLLDELIFNKRARLTPAEENTLVADLEGELSSLHATGPVDSLHIEGLTCWLAAYYRKKQRSEDVKRILIRYGQLIEAAAGHERGLKAASMLEKLQNVYRDFNLSSAAKELEPALAQAFATTRDDLKTVSTKVSITKEEIDAYVAQITDGDLFTVLTNIAVHFVEDEREADQRVRELAQVAVLLHHATTKIIDHDGVPVTEIRGINEDLQGHIVRYMDQSMQLSARWLQMAIEQATKKFGLNAQTVADHLYQSPVFDPKRRTIVQAGLEAYFQGEYLSAIHVLTPQVEHAIRTLVRLSGGAVLAPGTYGGYRYKGLGALFEEQTVEKSLGASEARYLRVLFTDPRGWNIRNRIAHGLCIPEEMGPTLADRVVHALLLIAIPREQDSTTAPQNDSNRRIGQQ